MISHEKRTNKAESSLSGGIWSIAGFFFGWASSADTSHISYKTVVFFVKKKDTLLFVKKNIIVLAFSALIF